jgi:hypothetical protein
MPDSRPLRPLRLLRLALVFAPPFGAVFACGVSEVVDPTTEDGGATDDAALVTAAACPATVVAGASCGAPEGTTCAADACGYGYFVCAKRVWVAFRGGASFRCPAVPPAEGELCSCVPKGADCTYGCGASGDAGGDGSGVMPPPPVRKPLSVFSARGVSGRPSAAPTLPAQRRKPATN